MLRWQYSTPEMICRGVHGPDHHAHQQRGSEVCRTAVGWRTAQHHGGATRQQWQQRLQGQQQQQLQLLRHQQRRRRHQQQGGACSGSYSNRACRPPAGRSGAPRPPAAAPSPRCSQRARPPAAQDNMRSSTAVLQVCGRTHADAFATRVPAVSAAALVAGMPTPGSASLSRPALACWLVSSGSGPADASTAELFNSAAAAEVATGSP